MDQFTLFKDPVFTLVVGLLTGLGLAVAWERHALRRERALRDHERSESDRAVARAKREIEDLQRRAAEYGEVFQFLPEHIRELLFASGPRPVAPLALALLERLFQPEQAAVFVARPSRRRLALVAGQNLPAHLKSGAEFDYGQGRLGYAARAGITLDETDFQAPRGEEAARVIEQIRNPEEAGLRGLKVEAAAPILGGHELLGVLSVGGVRRRRGHEKKLLALVAELAAVAFLQSRRLKAAEEADSLDGLTGVFNKRYLGERLNGELVEAQRQARPLSVLFLDIDHFQHYNRRNGHLAGDDLLRQLAGVLKSKVRDTDMVARVGGEEFVVVYRGAGKQLAMRLAEELRQEVEGYPFPQRAHQPMGAVTISGGVATFPDDATKGDRLVRVADDALYEAKAAGRNRVVSGEPHLQS